MTTTDVKPPAALRELAETSNAWPFEEARKIVARLKKRPKDEVIFETGYGPTRSAYSPTTRSRPG